MNAINSGFDPHYHDTALTLEALAGEPGPLLLEFGAPWCGHCVAATGAVQEVFAQHPQLRHLKVYDGKGKRLGRQLQVKLWPTLILLRDGEELARCVRPTQGHELEGLLSHLDS